MLYDTSISSLAFPVSWLLTFKTRLLLFNDNFTALDFSIEIVETLSTASLKSLVETTKLLVFSLELLFDNQEKNHLLILMLMNNY